MAEDNSTNAPHSRPVEYRLLTTKEIDQFTLLVCRKLGERFGKDYDTPDVRRELAAFLKVVSTIWAKHLNREGGLDKDHS